MSDNAVDYDSDEPVSGWQILYDDMGMLLFICIASPAIFYLIWGILEVAHVPVAGY